MVEAVRHFSTMAWHRVEARCASCEGVSELKLVAGIFLCAKCLGGVGSSVLGERSEGVSSTLPARAHLGTTSLSFTSDRIVGDDIPESGGTL
jgi:hypothetical protein